MHFPVHLPEGVALATNHTWSKPNRDGTITIGLDELLGRMVGAAERVTVPASGAMTDPTFADLGVEVNGRSLRFAAPVAGTVVEANTEVLNKPSLIASDPYGKGWLVRVKSGQEDIAASKQYVVAQPVEWLKQQVASIRDFIAINARQGQLAVLQEGGLLVEGALQQFDEDVWREFNQAFVMLHSKKNAERKENKI